MIDTHAHLDMPEFHKDSEEVIERAHRSGVTTVITMGTDADSSQQAVFLAGKHAGIYAAVGCHPHEVVNLTEEGIEKIVALSHEPKIVAVGEIGLDFYRNLTPPDIQVSILRRQLDIASMRHLPVIIHSRNANGEVQRILTEWIRADTPQYPPGVIHCFNGTADEARKFISLGFYIALGAYIGYPSSKMNSVVSGLPLTRILLETDCPFLPPQKFRGQRNEPSYLAITLQTLATIRGETMEEIEKITDENARCLFRLNVL